MKNIAFAVTLTLFCALGLNEARANELFFRETPIVGTSRKAFAACEILDGKTSCIEVGRPGGYTEAELRQRWNEVIKAGNDRQLLMTWGHRLGAAAGATAGAVMGPIHTRNLLADGRRLHRFAPAALVTTPVGYIIGDFFGTVGGTLGDKIRNWLEPDSSTRRAVDGMIASSGTHSYRGSLYEAVADMNAVLEGIPRSETDSPAAAVADYRQAKPVSSLEQALETENALRAAATSAR